MSSYDVFCGRCTAFVGKGDMNVAVYCESCWLSTRRELTELQAKMRELA